MSDLVTVSSEAEAASDVAAPAAQTQIEAVLELERRIADLDANIETLRAGRAALIAQQAAAARAFIGAIAAARALSGERDDDSV